MPFTSIFNIISTGWFKIVLIFKFKQFSSPTVTKILNNLNYFSTNTLLKKLSHTHFTYPLKYFQQCKNAVVLEPVSCWASNLRKETVMGAKSLSAAGGFKSQDKESTPFVHWEVLWHLPHIITFSIFYATQCRMYEQKQKKKPGQDNCGKTLGY
jgi:hypothetical protein